jgi:hypothetical protein
MNLNIALDSLLVLIPKYPKFISSCQLSAMTCAPKACISKELSQVYAYVVTKEFENEIYYSRRY